MLRRCLIAIVLLASIPALAQKRPFTFEDMMKLKRVGDFTVSPDSRWAAFAAIDVSLADNSRRSHLWVVSLAGGEARRLTDPALGTEDRPRFSPDGAQLLYTAVRNGVSQLYVQAFQADTGTLAGIPRQLTGISTEADGAIWSPDGAQVLFLSAVWPNCPDDACNRARDEAAEKSKVKAKVFDHLLYRHWNAYDSGKRSHLFLISAACSPAAPACAARDLTPGDHDVPPFSLGGQDQYQFSPDGREIAFTANLDEVQATSTNSDVFTLSLTDPQARPVNLTGANQGADSTPLYSPDGKYLAIRSQFRAGYESDRFRLQLIERATGKITNLTENFDRWVESVAWAPDSSKLYFTAEDAGDSPIYVIPVTGGEPVEIVRGFDDSLTPTADGKTLVFARSPCAIPPSFSPSPLRRPRLCRRPPPPAIITTTLRQPRWPPPPRLKPVSSPTSTTPCSPGFKCSPSKHSGSPVRRRSRSRASSSSRRISIPPRSIPSSSSSTAARKAHGETIGASAGIPISSPLPATSSS